MRGLVRSSVMRMIVLAGLVASIVPAMADAREAAPGGELIICSASGVRVATGTFTFTLVTVASAGGTTNLNVAVGTCTGRLFYPVGVSLTVSENVPASFAVTGITLNPTPGGAGTTSVITSNTPTAGSATVTIGSGQATLTFTTNGPAGAARLCKVPNLFGLALHGREGHAPQSELHRRKRAQGQVHDLLPRGRLQPKPAAGHHSRAPRPRQAHGQPRPVISLGPV